MEKVDSLAKLDHPASLQEFTRHLPAESLKKYVEQWRAGKAKKTPGVEILRTFLEEERQYQRDYKQLVGKQTMEEVTNSQGPSRSGKPNQSPKNQSKKAAASHSGQQQTNVKKNPCPFCKESKGQSVKHHYGTDKKVAVRLTACQAFKDKSQEDRAAFVEKVRR